MRKKRLITTVLAVMLAVPALDSIAGVYVYPAQGQSLEKQKVDEGACLKWASEQTGFDPTAPLQTTSPPPRYEEPRSSAGRGLLRGALLGTAIGAIAGDAGKGAAIGAGSGMLVGGVRRSSQVEASQAQQDAWARQQAERYAQSQHEFNQAHATCLRGRGYTVN